MKTKQQSETIKTATETDKQHVIDTIALAFTTDPTWRWNYPHTDDYLEYFPEFVRIYGANAFDHGTAHYVEGFAGAALWLPPGIRPDEDALITLFRESLSEKRREQARTVLEQLAEFYPDEPFWHLTVLGVEPIHQRKGYGTALLKHTLATCDQEGDVVYLESSNPENIPLYARHGFEVLGMIQKDEMPL